MKTRGYLAISAVVGWALAITVARAVRLPNDFAEAHWLLDYRFGLIRRGLAGQMLSWFTATGLARPSATTIAAVAVLGFGVMLAALLVVAVRLAARWDGSGDGLLASLVLATSPFVVMSAHLMGYFDHIMVVGALVAAWLVLRGRHGAGGAVGAAGVLVHENFLAIGVPLMAVALWRRIATRPDERSRWRTWLPLVAPVVAMGVLMSVEYLFLDRARLRQQLTERLLAFEFVKGDFAYFVPEWLTMTVADNLRLGWFLPRMTDPWLTGMVLPSLAVLLAAAWRLSRAPGAWKHVLVLAMACALPLLLHLVAWDTARIWTYPLFVAFGGAWILSESEPAPLRGSWALRGLALGVIAVNVYGHYPLMDNQAERLSALARTALYAPVLIVAGWALVAGARRRSPSHV